jgi:hypothetical protein
MENSSAVKFLSYRGVSIAKLKKRCIASDLAGRRSLAAFQPDLLVLMSADRVRQSAQISSLVAEIRFCGA